MKFYEPSYFHNRSSVIRSVSYFLQEYAERNSSGMKPYLPIQRETADCVRSTAHITPLRGLRLVKFDKISPLQTLHLYAHLRFASKPKTNTALKPHC